MEPGPDPLLGKTIQERYRIEKKLGQGGMGAVYLAEHVLIHKRVAIKCLHAGLASNPEVVRRFHNEALAATAIGHPNIVDVTDMGYFEDGSLFMVLEFLEGRDWQNDLETTGPQGVDKVAHIGVQVCEALAAAGEKGIVHRDMKPENIFLIERQGDLAFVKVLDFGISKFKDGLAGGTQTGQLMGTPYYMAPEQVRGAREITHHADLYSTGVMFYRALSGLLPFEANSLPELVLKIATETPISLGVRRPELPARLVDLVDRMLLKEPRDRPKDFDQVADILAEFDPTALRRKRRRVNVALLATDYGGSLGEAGMGELPPERQRYPTPVHERGPDTAAHGSPVAYVPSIPAPRGHEGAAPVPSPNSGTPAGFSVMPSTVPGVPKARSLSGAILAVIGLIAAAALALWKLSSPEPLAPSVPSAGDLAVQPALTSKKVRVQISTIPPDADVTLDGTPFSNPFDGELGHDDLRHVLRVVREGFEPSERALFLGSEQRVFVQLNPKAPGAPLSPDAAPTGPARPIAKKPTPGVATPAPGPTQPSPVIERVIVEKVVEKPAATPPPPPDKKSPLKKVF